MHAHEASTEDQLHAVSSFSILNVLSLLPKVLDSPVK